MPQKPNSIISLTWRHRRVAYTRGGPAGVLLTSEVLLGHQMDDIELMYEFQPRGFNINRAAVEVVRRSLNDPYFNVYYWVADLVRYWGRSAFVSHDPITAAGLALVGAPYILVYHSQGGLVYETEGQQGPMDSARKAAVIRAEELAFNGAQSVYFPSLGARRAYEETRSAATENARYADRPLYNTAPPFILEATVEDYQPIKDFAFARVNFVSIGSVTYSKGLDTLPAYFAAYKKQAGSDFRWFIFTNDMNTNLAELKKLIRAHDLEAQTTIIDRSLPRMVLHSVLSQCQYYIMAHRHSIFDLATLEAMRLGLVPLLSPVGGNVEVSVSDNIVYLGEPEAFPAQITAHDQTALSLRNRDAYNNHFGQKSFRQSYFEAMRQLQLP